jgi:hypothetical protein
MRRIIGTIGATLAVAAALGVGLVLTTNAVPQVAAAPAGGVQGHSTMDTYLTQALASGNVDEVLVKAQALASGNVDEVLVSSDVGSRVDHRMLYASWVPLADPAGGPNFFPLDEDARYYAAAQLGSGDKPIDGAVYVTDGGELTFDQTIQAEVA